MKKTRRFLAMALCAIMTCFGTTTAFAAENNALSSENATTQDVSTRAVGDILYSKNQPVPSGSEASTTITINTAEGNFDGDFFVGVIGNSGATYNVTMTTPKNKTYTGMVSSGGSAVHIASIPYAEKGLYTFTFKTWNGSSGDDAIVWIYD
ncbi:MAG: hypothetical protein KIC60_05310 [Clostridium sp.]|nr:hypothetical protein [Clostridium sp.]